MFPESPHVCFEEYGTAVDVSPDGRTATYPFTGRIVDLEHGRSDALASLSCSAFAAAECSKVTLPGRTFARRFRRRLCR